MHRPNAVSSILFGLIAAATCADAAAQVLPTRSARTQRYAIEAELADDAKSLRGKERVEWTNPSPAGVSEVQFHLYWNAWKNSRSSWLTEQGLGLGRRADRKVKDDSYGAVDVTRIAWSGAGKSHDGVTRFAKPIDLAASAKFIAPDDDNPADESVLLVALPEEVPPGGTIAIDLEFDVVVPRIVARSGRKDDFVHFAHWYPQLGVYEQAPGGGSAAWRWNTHQFHCNGEFFGEYASYDVTLTLPKKYEEHLGATGERVEGPTPAADGRVRYRYQQDDVHNFAWTADPGYVVVRRKFVGKDAESDASFAQERMRVKAATGLRDEDLALSDVDVTLLLQPEHADQAERHFRAVFESLRAMGLWCGRYPYKTLTVEDPRFGSGAGGMEYPTLFTAGTRIHPSANEHTPEGVVVHEFCHQFFYGLVGTNEFEHAWMDEGFTTYCTARVIERVYGAEPSGTTFGVDRVTGVPITSIPQGPTALDRLLALQEFGFPSLREQAGVPILPDDPALRWHRDLPFLTYARLPRPNVEAQRIGFTTGGPKSDRLNRASFEYVNGDAYRENAYYKPATALHTLQRLLGEPAWTRVIREYSALYRFRHPRPADFFAVVMKHAQGGAMPPPALERFLHQIFEGSDALDYGVESASTRDAPEWNGFVGRGAERRKLTKSGAASAPEGGKEATQFESVFLVARYGEVICPVDVEWKCEGRAPQRETWNGEERWMRKVIPPGAKLEWVKVDPDAKLLLDVRRTNNQYFIEGDDGYALRWTLRGLLSAETQLQQFGSIR